MPDCFRDGCKVHATHHIVVKVWPMGHPKVRDTAMKIVLGAVFCRAHAQDELKDCGLLNDDFWKAINGMTDSHGRVRADPASVELMALRGILTSEYVKRMVQGGIN